MGAERNLRISFRTFHILIQKVSVSHLGYAKREDWV